MFPVIGLKMSIFSLTRLVALFVPFFLFLNFFGIFDHLAEESYADFRYPLDIDLRRHVERIKAGEPTDVEPINALSFEWLLRPNASRCVRPKDDLLLAILVKSRFDHFDNRDMIRRTWGQDRDDLFAPTIPHSRLHSGGKRQRIHIRRFFLLGLPGGSQTPPPPIRAEMSSHPATKRRKREVFYPRTPGLSYPSHDGRYDEEDEANAQSVVTTPSVEELQARIVAEHGIFGDIVQQDFVDYYYNNTLKTAMGLTFAAVDCATAQFYLFVDDDYFISIANVLDVVLALDDDARENLYMGHRFFSHVMRHRPSAFYISLDEYPYNWYPPFITGGAYLLSSRTASDFQLAIPYVKLFRFDDVYVAIIARKLGIEPQHNDRFVFWEEPYTEARFRYLCAAHGFKGALLERAYADSRPLLAAKYEQKHAER